jgi:N-formylglutamate amidohydrolase
VRGEGRGILSDARASFFPHTGGVDGGPFDLTEPIVGETPVVVEVPHASVRLDPASMALCLAPVREVAADADLYVDELMADAPLEGASLIVSRWSRYVVDLNRDEDDVDERAVQGGTSKTRPWGLLWCETTRGVEALRGPVSRGELTRRLDWLYRPYHGALEALVKRKKQRFGRAVVLSAHSMPSLGVAADVVMGTLRGTSAARGLVDLVEQEARSFGWRVVHDDPYAGGATTRRHGNPRGGTHAIQIEFARRLYMDEGTLDKRADGFSLARTFCRRLVAKVGAAALG